MSDRFPAKISIGGKITVSLKEELAELIESEVAFADEYCRDTITSVEDVLTALDSAVKENAPVEFSDDQARYGEFVVEGFLRQHGIHFDRQSDAKYEYDGITLLFRGDKEFEFYSTQDGNLLVSYDKIREVIGTVTSEFIESIKKRRQTDIEKSFDEIEYDTKNVMADFLEKIMQIAPVIPSLEPLEFV